MKRLLLSVVITSTLGLTACGGKSSNEHKDDAVASVPQATLAFDPTSETPVLPLPSDLLFNGTTDGTLVVPGEDSGNYSDPQIALGALDGWSTTEPITIPVRFPDQDSLQNPVTDLGILPESVEQEGVARVFEVQKSGPLSFDSNCITQSAADALKVCRIEKELKYGEDFTTQVQGNNIAIVPLKPLKENQAYLYVTTDKIQDTYNRPIAGSSTFNILRSDDQLQTEAQQALQAAVHNYDKVLDDAGVNIKSITYAGMFTTQSINNVLEVTKAQMASDFAALYLPSEDNPTPDVCNINGLEKLFHPYAPTFDCSSFKQVFNDDSSPMDAYQALGRSGLVDEIYKNALVYSINVTLPIFNECSSVKCTDDQGNLMINGRWHAFGDSPLIVISALQSGKLTKDDFAQQAEDQGRKLTAQQAIDNPSSLVGLSFTVKDENGDDVDLDPNKLLTRYNPLPAVVDHATVKLQITIPRDKDYDGGVDIPAKGFPVVIGMHGISAVKEMSYAFSGIFSNAQREGNSPLATVTIDMPLHGERSFRKSGGVDTPYDVTATSAGSAEALGVPNAESLFSKGSPLTFINVESPLTIRGNFRQAITDQLSVRLLLNVISPTIKNLLPRWSNNDAFEQILDPSKITAQGLSLGAIVATDFAAYANSGVVDPRTGQESPANPYQIRALTIAAPSGGLSGAFAGSNSYGPLLYQNIQLQPQFNAALKAAANGGVITEGLRRAVYTAFIPDFGFAVQNIVDPVDPINYAARIQAMNASENPAKHIPIHLIEVVGGEGNLPDQVLSNQFNGLPVTPTEQGVEGDVLPLDWFKLTGTNPLIDNMGLKCVDGSSDTPAGSGVVRFVKGAHDSFVDPSSPFEEQPNSEFSNVLLEMQGEAANFLQTASNSNPQIVVSPDNSDLVTCN